MPHRGRHPNAYHEWILEQMQIIDQMPNMNQMEFIRQFNIRIKQPVISQPFMLRKDFWINNK